MSLWGQAVPQRKPALERKISTESLCYLWDDPLSSPTSHPGKIPSERTRGSPWTARLVPVTVHDFCHQHIPGNALNINTPTLYVSVCFHYYKKGHLAFVQTHRTYTKSETERVDSGWWGRVTGGSPAVTNAPQMPVGALTAARGMFAETADMWKLHFPLSFAVNLKLL